MYKYLNKKYILDINSGICHDLSNLTMNCQIYKIDLQDIFDSDYIETEIKRHPRYRKKCIHCLSKHYYG